MAGTGTTGGLPFATANGTTKAPTGGSSGSHDFVTDPQGSGPKSGGFDPVTMNRPQPPMKTQAGLPDADNIPAGGKILKADPGPVSAKVSGTAQSPAATTKPFRLGK